MKTTFGDTYYFLALLNPRDGAHAEAVAQSDKLEGRLLTTEYVLLEVGDALAYPADRGRFLVLLTQLDADPQVIIVPSGPELFRKGVELYQRRADKDWPLTDCISFVVMEERSVREALTGDSHFRQTGFVALLSSS